ncbi:MAG: acyl-ACP--UDP-N-acetylglucosamine O-acyltransferase [Burkholderiaceae bacterium]
MARVHPTALVDRKAELAADVDIGPYCIVGPRVTLGSGTVLDAHVVVGGRTTVGRGNRFFPFCAIGGVPQDKKYGGEDTELVMGDGNTVREHCTFSLGTAQGGGVTRIGSDNWVMASVHVAHDCVIGDHTILANNVTLAGHVILGDWVIVGGLSGLHQFCSMGAHAMAGGGSIILRDIPPYVICNGNPCTPHGINSEGLKRRGFDVDTVNLLRRAYKVIYRDGKTVGEAVSTLDDLISEAPASAAAIALLRDFVRDSPRGIIR